MKIHQVFVGVALALTAAVCAQDDCEDDYPPSPDLVPRIPGSVPPGRPQFGFGFRPAVLGQACAGVERLECGDELYCEATTQACQRTMPLGSECDPSLIVHSCSRPIPAGSIRARLFLGFISRMASPQRPGAVCVAQANGRGKCVAIVDGGGSCADSSSTTGGSCNTVQGLNLCEAGVCAYDTQCFGCSSPELGNLKICASDSDCPEYEWTKVVCRAAMDGRKRCLEEVGVANYCGSYQDNLLDNLSPLDSLRISPITCAPGTACDARTNTCQTEGVSAAIGEQCSDNANNWNQYVHCASGDSASQAFCPVATNEIGSNIPGQCQLDLTGKRCGADEDCASGGQQEFECDVGVCAKKIASWRDVTKSSLGSCGIDEHCFIYDTIQANGRCATADDGTNRCLQERQIGASCAAFGDRVRDFACAPGTRCHAPSQTCVRDGPPAGAGQPCGTTASVQFAACVEGTSCGSQINGDGFRTCV